MKKASTLRHAGRRGNLEPGPGLQRGRGPIPAHAGQPKCAEAQALRKGAYPRSRGATASVPSPSRRRWGLSPLTRGNQVGAREVGVREGPIPAHAGQPSSARPKVRRRGAYPRSRGATDLPTRQEQALLGLSPLTRGNRKAAPGRGCGLGPIPAHAGQPLVERLSKPPVRAYPRSRGATDAACIEDAEDEGLSPLTRGNPLVVLIVSVLIGPIPAHAGQPCSWRVGRSPPTAYPRSRGATPGGFHQPLGRHGLSPLTRGNLHQFLRRVLRQGPIPAHAGQPSNGRGDLCIGGAYPRSRGATVLDQLARRLVLGLSPLTRGNPARRVQPRR